MSVIEVVADKPRAAQAELSRLPEVRSVTQLGVRLRVLVPEAVPDPLSLVSSALGKNGLQADCEIVGASLEDVFVAVTLRDGDLEDAA